MIKLIQNEVTKILLKKKLWLILAFLIVFIGLFSYGEKYSYEVRISRFVESSESGIYNWENLAKQQIDDLKRRLDSPYMSASGTKTVKIEIAQLEYFIENDINPITPSAARFSVNFVEQSIIMFIPLLIIILSSDLVSGELTNKTIKILLTRSVPRWKVLLSKYIGLLIMTTVVIMFVVLISVVVSGAFHRLWGFNEPIVTGFKLVDGVLVDNDVILINRFQYMLLIYSLAWYVSLIIASITFMISVLIKSTAAGIGIVMATLIGGQFLQFFLADWVLVKYLFTSNMSLTKYLTGSYQPIEGMSLIFSVSVLAGWGIASLIVSFYVFTKRDVLV